MVGPLLPDGGVRCICFHDRQIAVIVAAKSMTLPHGSEIRVAHIPSGDVIFRTASFDQAALAPE
ncbi:MAG: hypothetical protein CFE44_03395 [Burkholderiales bacterium PBB4]|nr:MAG: hypothetical protein CFE44_03395 [Burkholderiales bacterium PBB4]